jgi:hypothetical protein
MQIAVGSGGKRVWMTASPYFFVFRSSITVSRMKLEGRGSAGELMAGSIVDEFAVLILLLFYRRS